MTRQRSRMTWILVSTSWMALGCGPGAPKTDPNTAPSKADATSISPTQGTPTTPAIAVGNDPVASLAQVKEKVESAFKSHDDAYKTIFPTGYAREGFQVLDISSEIVPSEPKDVLKGIVRVQYRELFSLIHPSVAEAKKDNELHPRIPHATREEMLDDRKNPVTEPWSVEIEYTAKDGNWVRADWQGKAKLMRGSKFLDRIGVP
ncbi:MAG: hypothetical protein U1D30_04575 [Planctomycetota bacterium]